MQVLLPKNKCKIDLDINGYGKPILFLHGWGQNKESFKAFAELFSDSYKTICISFPPFGNSSKLTEPLSIHDYSNIITELIEVLKLEHITIVCHSFGGRVAIKLGQNKNIEKIVFIDSAGIKPKFNLLTYLKIKKYKLVKFLVQKKLVNKKRLLKYGSDDFKNLNLIEKQSFIKIVNVHLNSYVKFIHAKCLIIFGKNDKITPVYMAKFLKNNIKNSKLEIIENCGHFCFADNLPVVYSLSRRFIDD